MKFGSNIRQRLAATLLVVWGGVAFAAGPSIEQTLRSELDRMFYPEQYILNVQSTGAAPASASQADSSGLPGLAFTGLVPEDSVATKDGAAIDVSGGGADSALDILFVADQSVSPQRSKIAEEVIRRVVSATGWTGKTNIAVRRENVLKAAPPQLAPQAAAPAPSMQMPQQPAQKSLFEMVEQNRDFASRLLLVLWGAVISIMVIWGLGKRYLWAPASASDNNSDSRIAANVPGAAAGTGAGGQNGAMGPEGHRKAATKDELYSKDQAILRLAEDIVNIAGTDPKKVAAILSRWVELSAENARYAAHFLRNCDIRTVEKVCALLHPTDIETIMKQQIDGFDPFSNENERVLDLMRGELALLAAKQTIKEKPNVFEFAKILSEDDLAKTLEGEPLEVVAMIATQVPPHRMGRFFASMSESELNLLGVKIAELENVSLVEMEVVRDRLQKKAHGVGAALVSDSMRTQTLTQLLNVVDLPQRQIALAEQVRKSNPELYESARDHILLATDLDHLPSRASKVLTQALDADTMGVALGGLPLPFEHLRAMLPEAYREVFEDHLQREHSESEQKKAWARILSTITELVASGLISDQELSIARKKTDEVPEDQPAQATSNAA